MRYFGKFLRPSPQARYISGNFFFPARASNFLKDFGKCRPAPSHDLTFYANQVEEGPPAWPITDKEQLRAYLSAIPESEEVHLVAFEFSGALLTALIATGKKAIGCDRRRPEHREPYYCGDVWDVVPLRKWACASTAAR
jgi:hypothetical protein